MNSYDSYINMQKSLYEDTNIPSKQIVGHYEWHEMVPYETFLLYKNGDIRQPIINETHDKTALDFGCGPGRMVKRMEKYFKRVDGVDISERLIKEARQNCPAGNFYVSKGDDLGDAPVNTYDFVYSTITMQHIAVRSIRLNILKCIREVLNDKGVVNIQMAFSKDFPYNSTNVHDISKDKKVFVKTLDNTHASWFEDRTDASATNSGCDVGIGPADVPLVVGDFYKYFKNIKIWFYDYTLLEIKPESITHRVYSRDYYWATHYIFIYGEK
ncbi:MAG: methyltransferase domain-containing protein [Clostridia bacterium]|nr:methyltransferase domain-containing protein [Clostridia bacterium]